MRNSSTVIEMTNRGQNILCGSEFSLYIPRSPHRRVRVYYAA
ncbi:MAG TPA: hypothetical protein VGI41_06820 [Candidatus Udaeobacter sp.]